MSIKVSPYHFYKLSCADNYVERIDSESSGLSRLDVQLLSKFADHSCTVWRVSWNLTGTILSSSGDDGCVRMWKSKSKYNSNLFNYYVFMILLSFPVNYLKQWKCAAVLKQDGQSPQDSSNNAAITTPNTTLATTKYYKRGNLSHPNEVLLH